VRDPKPVDYVEAEKLFDRIRSAHPKLHMILDRQPQHVDLEMTVPVQDGLSFPVRLNLRGDELHLEAGRNYRMEWFPGREPQVADRYFDAVDGLLAGRYRIVEHSRRGKVIRAELQVPGEGEWRILATWSRFNFPIPWRTARKVLSNE
jgi:hypothetical protein